MIAKTGYWNSQKVWVSDTIINGKYFWADGKTKEEAEKNLEMITGEKINHNFD